MEGLPFIFAGSRLLLLEIIGVGIALCLSLLWYRELRSRGRIGATFFRLIMLVISLSNLVLIFTTSVREGVVSLAVASNGKVTVLPTEPGVYLRPIGQRLVGYSRQDWNDIEVRSVSTLDGIPVTVSFSTSSNLAIDKPDHLARVFPDGMWQAKIQRPIRDSLGTWIRRHTLRDLARLRSTPEAIEERSQLLKNVGLKFEGLVSVNSYFLNNISVDM